ncbi:hypothetical protein ERO13_A02G118500v2 [Gossypium hirsutum]|uniref:Uncharacterized protein n=2 Tax=Gossypium TaxID=3633 RepID=A0A1U8NWH9_GOSHI|nr:uncharacterized protein LOC107952632 [Gossypium hirsutum]KAG4211707.1 hypothetical protein ERO13_A02G118500v2 [Gossypium hirsutum]TYI40165.1 hypothetical protein ES332_A02G144700v1 [Gossypium tomentosum]
MANVCCSIEMEPRTLNQGQLNHARGMAADVAQKMDPKEASASFIEGIGLMTSGGEIKEVVTELTLTDDEEKEVGVQNIVERPCQCSCKINNIESPDPDFSVKEGAC